MPSRDKTGPMGQGSKTGRSLGDCVKTVAPIIGAVAGLCYGFARGRGLGWRRNINQVEQSQELLENQELQQSQGRGFGRGLGRGLGFARGFGRGFGRR